MSFWGELKRRNVYKVGVAYAIVAWLIIQAVSITFPVLHLPGWAVTLVTVLIIIGFPFALLFAWAFEVTPDGIKRTKEVPLAESITHLTGQKLNYIVIGLLVLAVAYIVFDKVYIDRRATEPEMVSTEPEQAPSISEVEDEPKTIAVLPFKDISPEKDQEYFVDGLSEELINCLTKISDLHVTSRQSSFTFKNSDKTTQKIAEILGREYILEGSVRKVGNDLRITAQLIHAADDRHLWSETYNKELKDIYAVQEDIANSVADKLKLTLEAFQLLGGTKNVEAYELYLVAKGQWGKGHFSEMKRALESNGAALAIDPEFALAWALKATFQAWVIVFEPTNLIINEQDEALHAAERAIELAPSLAEAYESLGQVRAFRKEWFEAELAFRKFNELKSDSYIETGAYPGFLNSVGYTKKAYEVIKASRKNDPLNQALRGMHIMHLGILGDIERAEEEYKDGRKLFGELWVWGDHFIIPIRLGASDLISPGEVPLSDPINEIGKSHLDSREEGLAELQRLYTDEDNLSNDDYRFIAEWAAYFGDVEFAMDATEKSIELNGAFVQFVWLPVMHEVRQLPRFKKFAREIGLVDYWNRFGWPDICRPLDNGDFECD